MRVRLVGIVLTLFSWGRPSSRQTVANFKALATHSRGYGYRSAPIHRIVAGFLIQGGDIVRGDGTGGKSIFGARFPDETLAIKHAENGLVGMANWGPNTNASQFYIATCATKWLNGKCVVFGKVLEGYEIVEEIENVKVDRRDRPLVDVKIEDCGLVEV
mmetsp:Transcript_25434/g.63536  ORF Transcript_25434/g.63536 Transcript_25434/m.63536 type:complete len:159 (-) Transcript_25434:85-561(-)